MIPLIAGVGLLLFSSQNNIKLDPWTFFALSHDGGNVLVLSPSLTEAAYSENGFYYYYDGRCETDCLSVKVTAKGEANREGAYNKRAVFVLRELGYPVMSDYVAYLELLENPRFLAGFDTIILLHNEYLTKELYNAVNDHKNVIYLYPNSMYAEVAVEGNQMKLLRGHGYPHESIQNGFGWPWDNSEMEYDLDCENWKFSDLPNGKQLNCSPELVLTSKPDILLALKEMT